MIQLQVCLQLGRVGASSRLPDLETRACSLYSVTKVSLQLASLPRLYCVQPHSELSAGRDKSCIWTQICHGIPEITSDWILLEDEIEV